MIFTQKCVIPNPKIVFFCGNLGIEVYLYLMDILTQHYTQKNINLKHFFSKHQNPLFEYTYKNKNFISYDKKEN